MAQANAIIVRIRKEEAAEFERLFEAEELPLWEELSSEGKFLQARLARVEYGSEERDDIALYLIYAEVPSMAEHSQHASTRFWKKPDGCSPSRLRFLEETSCSSGERVHSSPSRFRSAMKPRWIPASHSPRRQRST